MKKITSAILTLAMLITLCACNGEPNGTETSVQSETESTPSVFVDPSRMLSSDAPSSDIPSNEGSKPDENVSSTISSISSEETSSEERIPEDPPPAQIEEEIEIEEERIEKLLTNPGVAIGDNLYLLEWHEAIYPENCYYLFYRYDLISRKMYLRSVISEYPSGKPVPPVKDGVQMTCKSSASGDKCIFVELLVHLDDSDMFYLDYEEGRVLTYAEYEPFTAEGEKELMAIPTDDEDPKIGEESFEVPATHPEYGNILMDSTAMVIPGQNKAVIAYQNNYTDSSTVVAIYDYDTNTFNKLTDIDGSVFGFRYSGDGYVFIDVYLDTDKTEWRYRQALYVYSLATGKINRVLANPKDGWDFILWSKYGFSNGVMRWSEYDYEKVDDGYNVKYIQYAYDVENDVKYEILRYDVTADKYHDPRVSRIVTKSCVVIEMIEIDGTTSLYYGAIGKTECISKRSIHHHVCEDQGYVMYYEEQEDGSFEWKYYNF